MATDAPELWRSAVRLPAAWRAAESDHYSTYVSAGIIEAPMLERRRLAVAEHFLIDAIAKLAQQLSHIDRSPVRVSLGPGNQLDQLSLREALRPNRQRVPAHARGVCDWPQRVGTRCSARGLR